MDWSRVKILIVASWIALVQRTEQVCDDDRRPCPECMEPGTHYEGSNLNGYVSKVGSAEECWYYCSELRDRGCSSFTFLKTTGECFAKTSSLSTVVRVIDPNAESGHLTCKRGSGNGPTSATFVTSEKPDNSGCTSTDRKSCKQYAGRKNHYCQQKWVQTHCKNMCGLCGNNGVTSRPTSVTSVITTKDADSGCKSSDPPYCGDYAREKQHYCKQTWVRSRCKNLCGLCGGGGVTSRPTSAAPVTSVTRASPACKSRDPKYCEEKYADKKEHYCQQEWVQIRCKILCGRCGGRGVTSRPTSAAPVTSATGASSSCVSTDPKHCEKYADKKKYYCKQEWVQNRCKNLCGKCGSSGVTSRTPGVTPVTSPKRSQSGCTSADPKLCAPYASDRNHYCQQTWVRSRCKNLCGLCGIQKDCRDDDPRCPGWAAAGECRKNPNYMMISCRKSCKVCLGAPEVCVDKDPECPDWADIGECKRNPAYMFTSCRKSCNACNGGGVPKRRPVSSRRRPSSRRKKPSGNHPDYITLDRNEQYNSKAIRKLFDSRLSDNEVCVEDGNRYRRKHANTYDLKWDPYLESAARRYAQQLFPRVFNAYLRTGWRRKLPVKHDPNNHKNLWGENIMIMSRDWKYNKEEGDLIYYCRKANYLWYDEIKDYDWRRGTTRNGKQIGHFTQMVWQKTERVGYAVVTRKDPYKRNHNVIFALLVAKYQRPGNYRGMIVQNVGRLVT